VAAAAAAAAAEAAVAAATHIEMAQTVRMALGIPAHI